MVRASACTFACSALMSPPGVPGAPEIMYRERHMPELVVAWTEVMLRKARRSEEQRVVRMFWRGGGDCEGVLCVRI